MDEKMTKHVLYQTKYHFMKQFPRVILLVYILEKQKEQLLQHLVL